jgi:hypothetical protein
MPKNDWNEYKKLVLAEMEQHGEKIDRVYAAIEQLREDVTGLKAKAAMMGGISGVIGTAVVTAIVELWRR